MYLRRGKPRLLICCFIKEYMCPKNIDNVPNIFYNNLKEGHEDEERGTDEFSEISCRKQ